MPCDYELTILNSADYAYYIENQTDPALPRAEVYNYRPYPFSLVQASSSCPAIQKIIALG